ncbi:cyclase [Pararhodobacter marinus]|uniref:Cyclase n=1 Tax=Pararhodobacter marinus TaxID=2184063 RepID=A0A2U2C3X7_9RHOB|nr:cyclase family protein [Pararhodobacter marinus]PWE26590.1 cyclase [Pararhodobacter marinus]
MCHACVMDSVKARMLGTSEIGRRALFKGALGLAGVAAAGAALKPAPAMAQTPGQMADMTHMLHPDFPTFFGEQQFWEDQLFNFDEHGFNLKELRVNEHTGTHVDSPMHFSADGMSVDEIPVDKLIVPLAVVDIRARAAENADAQVTPDDLRAWMDRHGDLPAGACVAMNSGWGPKIDDPSFRNADGEGVMHFPGFHVEAVQMLMEEADVSGIAVDTLSLDHGMSPDFATHYAWLPSGRWGVECLANLDAVPATGATLIVGAPKHRRGTGGPARVFTLF